MDKPIRLLLCSACLAFLAELALVVNWRILAPHLEAGAGVVTMMWIWPLCWLGMVVLAVLCLAVDRMISGEALAMQSRQTAISMLMRLFIPVLLLVGPGLILLYGAVMVLTAVGVTASSS